ncbi:hypothetical protein ON010_g2678 [Phytophthora cinnamomi]|nr:hypothetical protein ON010_g2678 [Phytophthora cinnamomi]
MPWFHHNLVSFPRAQGVHHTIVLWDRHQTLGSKVVRTDSTHHVGFQHVTASQQRACSARVQAHDLAAQFWYPETELRSRPAGASFVAHYRSSFQMYLLRPKNLDQLHHMFMADFFGHLTRSSVTSNVRRWPTDHKRMIYVSDVNQRDWDDFPDRPSVHLTIEDQDRPDFDEGLLPEDSWDAVLADDEYEVERIADMRSGRRTRLWTHVERVLGVLEGGMTNLPWVDEVDLNCGALLHDYLREQANRHRFEVMQSHEDRWA